MKKAKMRLWSISAIGAMPFVLALTTAGSSCLPTVGSSGAPPVDVTCTSVGTPFPWEGVSLAFPGGYVVQTGRARIAMGMGRSWDSFQAINGGLFDVWYGKGVSFAGDAQLVAMKDGSYVLNDGGTLVPYVKDDTVWHFHPVTWDGSVLSFENGIATIRRGQSFLRFEASGATFNGTSAQVLKDVCADKDCAMSHTVLVHAADGRLQTMTDACGKTTTLTWDGKGGRLGSIVTPGKKTVKFDYDDDGNPTAETYPDGNGKGTPPMTTYQFDGKQLTVQRLPSSNAGVPTWTYQLDDKGRFVKYVDAKKRWVAADYATGALVVTDMWNKGPVEVLTPSADKCTLGQKTDALGNVTNFTWTSDHKPVSASAWTNGGKDAYRIGTAPDGSDGYDAYGNVLLLALHDGKYVHRFGFDPSVTDENGIPFAAYNVPNTYTGPDKVTITVDKLSSVPWAWKLVQHAKATGAGVNGSAPFTDEYNASYTQSAAGQLQIDESDTLSKVKASTLLKATNGLPMSSTLGGVQMGIAIPDDCSSVAFSGPSGVEVAELDDDGDLVALVDEDGNRMVIHRNATGVPYRVDLPNGESVFVTMADNQVDLQEAHVETRGKPGVPQRQIILKRTKASDPTLVNEIDVDGVDLEDGVSDYPAN